MPVHPVTQPVAGAEAVTDATFAERVLHSKGLVLVDYWATWCGPCRMLSPVLAELAGEIPELTVLTVDTDANPAVARDQQVMAVPTVVLYRDGEPVTTMVGARPKAAIRRLIDPHL